MTGLKFCNWEGRPAIWTMDKAIALIDGEWIDVDCVDVGTSAYVMELEDWLKAFPGVSDSSTESHKAAISLIRTALHR